MTKEGEPPRYITVAEAAARIGFKKRRIMTYLESRRIVGIRDHGKVWRWLVDVWSLEQFERKTGDYPKD